MKIRNIFLKSLFGFFCITLMSSCDVNNWADSVIVNDSEFIVTFKFNNTKEKQLETGNSLEFKTAAYQHMEFYSPEKRVYFIYEAANDGYAGLFLTRPSWLIKVNNAIGENATLSADGWMDPMIDITAGYYDDENHTGKIYTDNPNFSVETESGFPAVAIFNKNKFLVTIQWSP